MVFAAADDGKIDYSEIVGLADKWGLSIDEAEAYARKILEDFGFNIDNLNAPISVEEAWAAAYGSVEDYKAIAEGVFIVPSTINDASDAAAIGWISAAAALSAYAAAAANAAIVTPPVIPKLPVIPPIIPPVIPPVIPPGFGGDDGPRYVPRIDEVVPFATGGIVTSPTIAMIGEAGPEAVIPLGQMGSMGGTTINLTINGSVTSEGDLVNTIRNALLQGQNNGQAIVKNAILI